MISFLNPDIGAAHSVELLFVFNLRGPGTASSFNGTNISEELLEQKLFSLIRQDDPLTEKERVTLNDVQDKLCILVTSAEQRETEAAHWRDVYNGPHVKTTSKK